MTRGRVLGRAVPAGLLVAITLGLVGLLVAAPVVMEADVAAAHAEERMPRPGPGRPWFGPELDIETAVPRDYAAALGASPSSFTFQVNYPLDDDDTVFLERQVRAIATLGAVVVVDLQPRRTLTGLEVEDAEDLGRILDGLHRELGTWFLVRFAAEMNGSWEPWGQQPVAYRAGFRKLAEGLETTAPYVETVWSPVYGSGYPFRDANTDGARSLTGRLSRRGSRLLDTDGDGRLTSGDAPYAPYFPGDDVVDWVGLTLYRFGQDQGIERNVVPRGEYAARLRETWGYADGAGGGPSFYDRFAAAGNRPMLVQTSALYNPEVGGVSELALKRSWWRQVFGAATKHPLIGLISWLEVDRIEPEVDTRAVDWRVTAEPAIAAAIRADLERSSVDLGPVSAVVEDPLDDPDPVGGQGDDGPGVDEPRKPPDPTSDPTSDVVPAVQGDPGSTGLAVAAGILLLLLGAAAAAGLRRPQWTRTDDGLARDPKLDAVRGLLVALAVTGQVIVVAGQPSFARSALGVLPVPEGLVLVSGIAIGIAATVRVAHRAFVLYAAAVLSALAVQLLSLVPGVGLGRLTGITDPVTGERRGLFPDADRLFDYPTPWAPAQRLLLLEVGPWVTSMLGLFVVLTLATPLALWFVRRSWWLSLVASWALWGLGQIWDIAWSVPQAADAYPPLVWQLLLVHGLVLGHHRKVVLAFLVARGGGAVLALGALGYAGVGAWLVATERSPDPALFAGNELPLGRLLLVAVTGSITTVFVTRCWGPLEANLGRILAFLGRHALGVGLAHVALVAAVAAALG